MEKLQLLFTGDICLQKRKNLQKIFSNNFECFIKKHDILCCNYEAPIICDTFSKSKKIGPSLSQDISFLQQLKEAGFNLFNLANNHICDYGQNGLQYTIENLSDVDYIGADFGEKNVYQYKKLNRKGRKIAFISLAENGFGACLSKNMYGFAWIQHARVEKMFENARKECDFVICICHAGAEDFDLPLPEIRTLYKKFIDLGADLIIAHHPHVIQGSELYKGKHIFYSLGNFAFDSLTNSTIPFNPNGIAVSIKIEEEKIVPQVIPTIYKNGIIDFDSEKSLKYYQQSTAILNNQAIYNQKVNEFCKQMYRDVYSKYLFFGVTIKYQGGLFRKITTMFKLLFGKIETDDNMMFHNIVIETPHWICKRALQNIYTEHMLNENN